MKVIDPGHLYALATLDGASQASEMLRFVKRIGDNFPGNEAPAYGGTTSQEVLRALIDRTKYVDAQKPHPFNRHAIGSLRMALDRFESRAAGIRGEYGAYLEARALEHDIESLPTCSTCGHIACLKHVNQGPVPV